MRLLVGIVIAGSASSARAERAITVDVAALVPLSSAELTRALRVRLPAVGEPVHVRVSLTPTGVQVESTNGSREVDVAGLHGADAARLVALAANDLLLDDLATAPVTAKASSPPTISVLGGVASWDSMLGGGGIDVVVPRGGVLLAIELGGGALVAGPLDLTAATARLGGGVRSGVFELRGGLTFASIFVADGAGDTTVLVGAGASVRARLPVAPRVRAVFAAGVDAFATQTEYRQDGMTTLTTPRVAPWLGVGVEVVP